MKRLQTAQATYDKVKWDKEHNHNNYFIDMIRKNSSKIYSELLYLISNCCIGRYIKHPYFLNPHGSNLFPSQSHGEFYQSMHSGRTMSAQPGSRMQVQSAGMRRSQNDMMGDPLMLASGS